MRVNAGGEWTAAGRPYCTMCSRLALAAGLKTFVLWTDGGAKIYDAGEYNLASYEFYKKT